MSAGICIMNKNAIALAADSAVTIGGGVAIHNSVNKLFALSRKEPIGAIIYANANFMQTPVEVILKQYRREIDSKCRYFNELEDYVIDFIDFLIRNKQFLRFETNEEYFVLSVVDDLFKGMDGDLKNYYSHKVEQKKEELTEEEYRELYEEIIQITEKFVAAQKVIKDFDKTDYIRNKYGHTVLKYIEDKYDVFSDAQKERLKNVSIEVISRDFYRSGYVGICFAGYGIDEIYPTMIHIHLAGIIDDSVKYKIVEKISIDENKRQSITPLAQVDVMETFLYGMNNSFLHYIQKMVPETLGDDIDSLEEDLFANNKKAVVKNRLEVCTAHIVNNIINEAQKSFFVPIGKAIGGLPMDELGMLAESMVNLTSLRRKVAIDSNSRTVGGPVDVAIISKGDGFIWSKRKHYFTGELNPQYFSNNFGRDVNGK